MSYDKDRVKEALTEDNYLELLDLFGADPIAMDKGYTCCSICHNPAHEGGHKLYLYISDDEDKKPIFHCYSQCGESFDIYALVQKVFAIQKHKEISLDDAIRWVASYFGIAGDIDFDDDSYLLADWEYFNRKPIEINNNHVVLPEYDNNVLSKFNYNIRIPFWEKDNISQEVIKKANIGYYGGECKIIIPHYDIDGRLVGIRGRTLVEEEAEKYGKYIPIKIGDIRYSHPLGYNLYGLNWAKENIKTFKKAIIFEAEKSVLAAASYMGFENNICVACCGSAFSNFQFQFLKDLGVNEIIIGFDKDFLALGDDKFQKQVKNLKKINERFGATVKVSFMFDRKNQYLPLKGSPTDAGKEIFFKMFNERFSL